MCVDRAGFSDVWPAGGGGAGSCGPTRPATASIRVDHGTEFTSRALDAWAWQNGVELDFIRPGKPTENGMIESFNGRLCDECLNCNAFLSIDDARQRIEAWRNDYNGERPHSALGNLTPTAFVEMHQSKEA